MTAQQKEVYLGDGLYVSYDGWQLCLRAPREDGVDHVVFLEPQVLVSFEEYVRWLRGTHAGETL